MAKNRLLSALNLFNWLRSFASFLGRRWSNFSFGFPRAAKAVKLAWRLFIVVFLIDIGYLMGIWPDWKWYSHGTVPKSQFILAYEREASQNPTLPRLRWQPVELRDIPSAMIRSVIAAEDSRFFQHEGIDVDALKNAMEYNWERKSFIYGASTISQQTTKNLFLSPSRDPFRKWHEFALTFAMEQNISKRRILELYLNVAEFGRGIYGIDAAAKFYWGISADEMSDNQALELAATLPAPTKHNPKTRTNFFLKKKQKIRRNLGR